MLPHGFSSKYASKQMLLAARVLPKYNRVWIMPRTKSCPHCDFTTTSCIFGQLSLQTPVCQRISGNCTGFNNFHRSPGMSLACSGDNFVWCSTRLSNGAKAMKPSSMRCKPFSVSNLAESLRRMDAPANSTVSANASRECSLKLQKLPTFLG